MKVEYFINEMLEKIEYARLNTYLFDKDGDID